MKDNKKKCKKCNNEIDIYQYSELCYDCQRKERNRRDDDDRAISMMLW